MKTPVIIRYKMNKAEALKRSKGTVVSFHARRVHVSNLIRLAINRTHAMTKMNEYMYMLLFIIPGQSFSNMHAHDDGNDLVNHKHVVTYGYDLFISILPGEMLVKEFDI